MFVAKYFDEKKIHNACATGNIDEIKKLYLKWKTKTKSIFSQKHILVACEFNKIEIVKYLTSLNIKYDVKVCAFCAFSKEHFDIVKYFISNCVTMCDVYKYLEYACEKGYIDIVKYIYEKFNSVSLYTNNMTYISSYNNNLDITKYLLSINDNNGKIHTGCAKRLFNAKKYENLYELIKDDTVNPYYKIVLKFVDKTKIYKLFKNKIYCDIIILNSI